MRSELSWSIARKMRHLLATRVGLPAKRLIKRDDAPRVLRELDETQWYRPQRLRDLRTERLREVLVSVATHVPFYRGLLRGSGMDPRLDDPWTLLAALPPLDKARIRELGDALISERPANKPIIAHTSGTTGERLAVRIDQRAASYRYLAGFRGRRWWGIEPGDSEYKIWGSGRKTATGELEFLVSVLKEAKDWMVGITLVSPFFRSDDDLRRAADLLFRVQPRFVFGYANSVFQLAAFLDRRGRRAGPGWPAAVGYTSEMLTERQKETVGRAFGAPVVSEYGSCEAGVMAYECPAGQLHCSDDFMVIETLDANGRPAAGPGEIVVSNLLAHDYPLLRYRQGDVAQLLAAPCPCGRGLGVMSALVGRMNDRFYSVSGGIIDFIVFDQAMKDQPAIQRFKVVERATGRIDIVCKLHEGSRWAPDDRQRLLQHCGRLLPGDVTLEAFAVRDLPPEPSGKFKIMVPRSEQEQYPRP